MQELLLVPQVLQHRFLDGHSILSLWVAILVELKKVVEVGLVFADSQAMKMKTRNLNHQCAIF